LAPSDREREEPPPDPRRSLTERFRPEDLSAYIASARRRERVGFGRRGGAGRTGKRRGGENRGRNGNRRDLEVCCGE
jgi:hypothetical protein